MFFRITAVLVFLYLPTLVHAQTSAPAANWIRQALESHDSIRVTRFQGDRLEGRVRSFVQPVFVIGAISIHIDSVRTIEVRQSRRSNGTITGTIIGAGLGALLLSLATPDSPCSSCLLGAVALTGAGAVIGTATSRGTSWETVWSRD